MKDDAQRKVKGIVRKSQATHRFPQPTDKSKASRRYYSATGEQFLD